MGRDASGSQGVAAKFPKALSEVHKDSTRWVSEGVFDHNVRICSPPAPCVAGAKPALRAEDPSLELPRPYHKLFLSMKAHGYATETATRVGRPCSRKIPLSVVGKLHPVGMDAKVTS